jgi:hypothetical protein
MRGIAVGNLLGCYLVRGFPRIRREESPQKGTKRREKAIGFARVRRSGVPWQSRLPIRKSFSGFSFWCFWVAIGFLFEKWNRTSRSLFQWNFKWDRIDEPFRIRYCIKKEENITEERDDLEFKFIFNGYQNIFRSRYRNFK